MEHNAPSAPRTQYLPWAMAAGFASTWLVFPLLIGPLGLLREHGSWAMLLVIIWISLRQNQPEDSLVHTLAWGLIMAALANSGQGLLQAYAQWRPASPSTPTDVYGFLHQRNQFASLNLMALAACAWVLGRSVSSTATRTFVLASAVVLGAAVSLSASRTGLLGLALLWVAYETLACKRAQQPFAASMRQALRAGALGYLLALLPALIGSEHAVGILARQDTQEGVNVCHSRLSLWANVLELVRLKPWLGWGWGELDYAHFVTTFQGERFCELLANAHNLPLHLAVELGLPLTGVFCSLVLWGLWRGQPWREQNPDRLLAWSILLVIGVHSLLEYPLWYGPFQASTLLGLWILVRTPRQATPDPAAARSALPRTTAQGLQMALGLGLLATALVAADYYRASQIYLQPAQRLGMYRDATAQQIQKSVFFQDVIDFARLGLTEVTEDNAVLMHALALKMLHFSPEAMVVQKLLRSARLLGLQDEYDYYQQRFAAAYPDAFVQWKANQPGD